MPTSDQACRAVPRSLDTARYDQISEALVVA